MRAKELLQWRPVRLAANTLIVSDAGAHRSNRTYDSNPAPAPLNVGVRPRRDSEWHDLTACREQEARRRTGAVELIDEIRERRPEDPVVVIVDGDDDLWTEGTDPLHAHARVQYGVPVDPTGMQVIRDLSKKA